jgi:hypothetical protein
VVHGAPNRFSDPARFSFAHGGKDRHPFPVPLKTYDESIGFLKTALDSAKVEGREKLDSLRRLDKFVNSVEDRLAPRADFERILEYEQRISPSLSGRSVYDDLKERKKKLYPRQQRLF